MTRTCRLSFYDIYNIFYLVCSNAGIRKQEGYVGIVGVAKNPYGRDLAWSWFKTNWDIIKDFYNVVVSDISMPGVSPAISVIIKVAFLSTLCSCS
jgi:hypothetical protein